MGVTDENGNDITVDSAELTNSTSVVMSTVKGNKNAIGYISLGSLSSDVKAVGLDGVAPSTVTVKDGSYKQRKITRNPARKAQSQLRVQPRSLRL